MGAAGWIKRYNGQGIGVMFGSVPSASAVVWCHRRRREMHQTAWLGAGRWVVGWRLWHRGVQQVG